MSVLVASPRNRPLPAAAMQAQATAVSLWPAIIVTWLLIVPPMITFSIGTFIFFPYRALLLFLTPWIIQHVVRGAIKLGFGDFLVCAMLAWIFVALTFTEGFDKAIANGGASAIDIGISYFLARCTLTSVSAGRKFLSYVGPVLLFAGCTVAAETVTGRYLVQPLFAQFFGRELTSNVFTEVNQRLGLIRGTGPFPHPILAGLLLASLMPIYSLSGLKIRALSIGVFAAILSMATLSSAAFLSLTFSSALIAYELMAQFAPFLTWRRLLNGMLFVGIFLQFAAKGGIISIIVNTLSFDKYTAYYRLLIWQYGSLNVAKHPWIGIGFGEWERPLWMPPSVDNYWLFTAMNYGLPNTLARLLLPIFAVTLSSLAMANVNNRDRRFVLGWAIAVALMTLMGFTVSFWGVTQTWYFFIIGGAISLSQGSYDIVRPAQR